MPKSKKSNKRGSSTKKPSYKINIKNLSKKSRLIIFVLSFGLIGGALLWAAQAASQVGALEAELATGSGQVINDNNASGGKALYLTSTTPATSTINFTDTASQITLKAKGSQCHGSPQAVIFIDDVQVITTNVSSAGWATYATTLSTPISSGNHSVKFTFANPQKKGKCSKALYIDILTATGSNYTPPANDTTSPTTTITSPADGATNLTGVVSIKATASDNSSVVAKIEYYIDDAKVTTITAVPYTFDWDTTATSNSTHSIKVIAYDAANNAASSTVSVSVNNLAAPTTSDPMPVGLSGDWALKFKDDFDGTAVDTTKWNVQNNSNYGAGNKEDQCYLAANTTVAGGLLSLTAKKETVGSCPSNPEGYDKSKYYWTSGMITTKAQGGTLKYKFTQGYAEVKMKAPSGNPYWPAFWLVSTGESGQPAWPAYGEFDIVELYGGVPDNSFGTLHYACPGHCKTSPDAFNLKANNYSLGTRVPPLATGATNDWHTYGLLWTADRLTWYIDGKPRLYFDGIDNTMHTTDANGNSASSKQFAAPSTNFWSIAHSIHLNLAVGGVGPTYYGFTGKESATTATYENGNLVGSVPQAMQVDYVRVWQ